VIEIDNMADCVQQREEKSCASSNLVELKHAEMGWQRKAMQ
jgi:hypothetical protein